jgi:hypothetical protein
MLGFGKDEEDEDEAMTRILEKGRTVVAEDGEWMRIIEF